MKAKRVDDSPRNSLAADVEASERTTGEVVVGLRDENQASVVGSDWPDADKSEVAIRMHTFHFRREEALMRASIKKMSSVWPVRDQHFATLALSPFRAVFQEKNLAVVGTKKAMYEEAFDIEEVKRKLGPLKILHIVRNPIDAIASSLNRRNLNRMGRDVWHIKDVRQAALEWSAGWHQLIARKEIEAESMLILKYEDFGIDFRTTADRIAAFLGVKSKFKDIFLPVPGEVGRGSMESDELSFVDAMFGELDQVWAVTDVETLMERFASLPPLPAYTLGEELTFTGNACGRSYLHAGFNLPEEWGVWTQGPRAQVAFRLPERVALSLTLHFRLFVRPNGESASFVLKVNGCPISRFGSRTARWGETFQHTVIIPAEIITRSVLELEFIIVDGRRPEECTSKEARQIGLGLESLRLSPLSEAVSEVHNPISKGSRDGLILTSVELEAAQAPVQMDALAQAAVRRQLLADSRLVSDTASILGSSKEMLDAPDRSGG